MHLLFLLLFLTNGAKYPVYGQLVTISARFDTTKIWIGEQTDFLITVTQPEDMHVSMPAISDTLTKEVEILASFPPDTIYTENSNIRIKKRYRVTSFDPGEHFVRPLAFGFDFDGDQRVLSTPGVRIEVISPDIDQAKGIYDIKEPFTVPVGIIEILSWILSVIALLIILWLIFRFFRRRREADPVSVSLKPAEPAHVYALRELKKLREESPWRHGRIKEYYTRLTEIIRIYIERRYSIRAMEQTTGEIIGALQLQNLTGDRLTTLLHDCLSLADLVKFAKVVPGDEEIEESLNTAFRFVKETCETSYKRDIQPDELNQLPETKEQNDG